MSHRTQGSFPRVVPYVVASAHRGVVVKAIEITAAIEAKRHVLQVDAPRGVTELPARAGGDTPALALAAFAHSQDRRRAWLADFHSRVAKPVEPAELVTLVASLPGRLALSA